MSNKKHDDDAKRDERQPAREGPLDPRFPPDDPRQSMSNPNIPAAPQPNAVPQVEESPGHMASINEPPGSNTFPPPTNEAAKKDPAVASSGVTKHDRDVSHETSELPSDAELERMTRADLDNLAQQRGVDVSDAHNKDDVIAALRKDARKRR
jgi:hypothetical protein